MGGRSLLRGHGQPGRLRLPGGNAAAAGRYARGGLRRLYHPGGGGPAGPYAAYALEPTAAIALDVTAAGDTPQCQPLNAALGKGPAIKIMDSSVICHPRVIAWLEEAARQAGVTTQREVLPYGGTDTAAIQASRQGVPSGAISVACRYIHSRRKRWTCPPGKAPPPACPGPTMG